MNTTSDLRSQIITVNALEWAEGHGITVDFSAKDPYTQALIDSSSGPWPCMTKENVMGYLIEEGVRRYGSYKEAERQIKKRCRWKTEWKEVIKEARKRLGSTRLRYEINPYTYDMTFKPEYDHHDQWRIESGKQTTNGAEQEPNWRIFSILGDGGLLVSGLPHSTKSLAFLLAMLECVTSRLVWGKFRVSNEVRNVVFIETEDPLATVKRRIRGFCKGLGIDHPPSGFHLVRPGPFDLLNEGEERLREIIDKTQADVLVLSTLQGLLNGADWKEQRDMAPINAIFVRLMQVCPLILLTHSPWNEKRAAGSVTQSANFSSLMHFEKQVTDSGTVTQVKLDSKESSEDSKFGLSLVTAPHGEDATQVRRMRWTEARGQNRGGRPSAGDEEKKHRAIELHEDGMSIRQIAKEIGVSKSLLGKWLKEAE